ncbi:MAG: uncharacterized protein A8A55_2034 [Amphiamblys sp. WSBS2006]|nr:MAG: uncharacterized protein A8A55_2034 [Amphiamblys sp. WSBS2006]
MTNILVLALATASFFAAEKFTSCVKPGHFAFTFDQAPSPNTGVILNTFQRHKVKTTFHITVNYLENPVILAYLRKAVSDGHLIGIFVENEKDKEDMPEEKRIDIYLRRTSALIKKHISYTPKFLRFPHPGPGKALVKKLESQGYIVTSFNLDSGDYEYVSENDASESIFKNFKKTVDQILQPAMGAFISVQRDSVEASARQTEKIVAYVLKKGYKIVRLDECVGIVKGEGYNGKGGQNEKNALEIEKMDEEEEKKTGGITSAQIGQSLLWVVFLLVFC